MQIDFTKMHGLGNDFVVIDAREHPVAIEAGLARRLADRRRGIGCDQVLLMTADDTAGASFGYRIFNASGGEVQQCGNGARALARLARPGAGNGDSLRMHSPAGSVDVRFHDDGEVSVNMGAPEFAPASLPFLAAARAERYEREVEGRPVCFGAVSMGNPHAVIEVDSVASVPVAVLGAALERHADFPEGVNVGFAEVIARDRIALRVWERGVGETLACGTGACAAVAVCYDQQRCGRRVVVELPGGELMVDLAADDSGAWLKGAAAIAFEGTITV